MWWWSSFFAQGWRTFLGKTPKNRGVKIVAALWSLADPTSWFGSSPNWLNPVGDEPCRGQGGGFFLGEHLEFSGWMEIEAGAPAVPNRAKKMLGGSPILKKIGKNWHYCLFCEPSLQTCWNSSLVWAPLWVFSADKISSLPKIRLMKFPAFQKLSPGLITFLGWSWDRWDENRKYSRKIQQKMQEFAFLGDLFPPISFPQTSALQFDLCLSESLLSSSKRKGLDFPIFFFLGQILPLYNFILGVTLFKAKQIWIRTQFIPEDSDKFQINSNKLWGCVTQYFEKWIIN